VIYIDTSSLLRLLITDAHSDATDEAISKEKAVIVSTLTELEARVQLRALFLGGKFSKARALRVRMNLEDNLRCAPFELRDVPASVFSVALTQNEASQIHCRSLDRIHLAAMTGMGIKRLMTHDDRQAVAARELGFAVVMPGMG
jgi:predicted nucleic acid-binding protein